MADAAAADSEPLKPVDWTTLSDEKLLEVRMCDLALAIEGTELEARIAHLNAELAARGLTFKPHYYLSDEWFTPDGIPGIAIPFYLAHPRLAKLEEKEMLEVEGGDEASCLRTDAGLADAELLGEIVERAGLVVECEGAKEASGDAGEAVVLGG